MGRSLDIQQIRRQPGFDVNTGMVKQDLAVFRGLQPGGRTRFALLNYFVF
jgi:hypothetical protein